jgi:hypothetical protein
MAVLAAAGLTILLAGCAAAAAPPAAPTVSARPSGSGSGPAGTRAQALALAQRLLSQVFLPPGTRPAHLASVPQPISNPWGRTDASAVAGRVYLAPQRMDSVNAFMRAHAPDGMRPQGTGRETGPGGVLAEDVDWVASPLAAGIYSAYLDVLIGPHSGGTALIGVYASVTWIPARSAAEHIDPSRYQRITIAATEFGEKVRRITRTFTQQAVVARLAGYLNGLTAAPNLARSCPFVWVSYLLTFTGPGVPAVVVSADGCLSDGITVGGKTQPGLDDPSNGLAATAGQLLNIGPASHYSGGSRLTPP